MSLFTSSGSGRAKPNRRMRKRKSRNLAMLVAIACIATFFFIFSPDSKDAVQAPAPRAEALDPPAIQAEPDPQPVEHVARAFIRKGDSVSTLLDAYLSPLEIHELSRLCKKVFPLSRIRAGRPYSLVTENGRFLRFEYEMDDEEKLVVCRDGGGFTAEREPIRYAVSLHRVEATIDSSLFLAVSKAGEGAMLAVKLADIFGWEIDFVREIRSGDAFTAVVEKRFRKGKFAGYGNVLMAEFTNQGKRYQGYRFDGHGRAEYFDAEGRNLRRAFLKVPLDFKRISSGFSRRRLHPVHKIYLPHPGIDYAAPTGTPVKAVADGTVTFAGRGRGEGNFIRLRHNNGYETMYLHLSRFARGLKKGGNVRQGQVIGFVGATGTATGPHLDFRMKRHGKYLNPGKVENPRAENLPRKYLGDFHLKVAEYRSLLHRELAQN